MSQIRYTDTFKSVFKVVKIPKKKFWKLYRVAIVHIQNKAMHYAHFKNKAVTKYDVSCAISLNLINRNMLFFSC